MRPLRLRGRVPRRVYVAAGGGDKADPAGVDGGGGEGGGVEVEAADRQVLEQPDEAGVPAVHEVCGRRVRSVRVTT